MQEQKKEQVHRIYMRRCFQLAKLGLGFTRTNPIVGSVIVHDHRIIGEGYHQRYGEAHAEVNAVRSVAAADQHLLPSSTIYVSLEPCFHFGKTPPCVDLILRHRIPRVVISVRDPFPKVAGKSIEKLRAHGVEVTVGVLEAEGKHLIRRFLTNVKEQRAYVVLKFAQSKDGFMGKANEQVWLTNPYAKRLVHRWRHEESAILIGANTARIDNPQLTNRLYLGEFGQSPIRIVLNRSADLPTSLHLMQPSADTRTILIGEKNPIQPLPHLEYWQMDFNHNFIPQLLSKLYQHKISSLIIEGGAVTLQHFIDQQLWDEARVFTADKYLGDGIRAPRILSSKLPPPIHTLFVGSDELVYYETC